MKQLNLNHSHLLQFELAGHDISLESKRVHERLSKRNMMDGSEWINNTRYDRPMWLCMDEDGGLFLYKDEPKALVSHGEWGYNEESNKDVVFIGWYDESDISNWEQCSIKVDIRG